MKPRYVYLVALVLTLVLVVLGVGYLLRRPLFRWTSASNQQARSSAVAEEGTKASAEVILLPADTFDYDHTADLEKELAAQSGLQVKAILPTPLDKLQPFPGTTQFSGPEILTVLDNTITRLRTDYGPALVIVSTNRDINQPERNTLFVFSFTDKIRRASIASSSRL